MSNVITIDGPASSGKSSVGHLFSHQIGYRYIDSGVIYRCYTYFVLQNNIQEKNPEKLAKLFKNLKIEFKTIDEKDKILLNGEDVTEKIHQPKISKATPEIAAIKEVREISDELKRQLGNSQNTVMAGRDIGSIIFPDAKLKFYITANAEVRAKRRFDQLKEKDPSITFKQVLEDTKKRDKQDSERAVAPLVIPEGAVVVDTSDKTIEESVEVLMNNFRKI